MWNWGSPEEKIGKFEKIFEGSIGIWQVAFFKKQGEGGVYNASIYLLPVFCVSMRYIPITYII